MLRIEKMSTLFHVTWMSSKIGKLMSEAYPEPCQTLQMEFSAKMVNGFQPLTIFIKTPV